MSTFVFEKLDFTLFDSYAQYSTSPLYHTCNSCKLRILEQTFLVFTAIISEGYGDLKLFAKFLACIRPAHMRSLTLSFENSSPALDVGGGILCIA
jgi:hypothetical protein